MAQPASSQPVEKTRDYVCKVDVLAWPARCKQNKENAQDDMYPLPTCGVVGKQSWKLDNDICFDAICYRWRWQGDTSVLLWLAVVCFCSIFPSFDGEYMAFFSVAWDSRARGAYLGCLVG